MSPTVTVGPLSRQGHQSNATMPTTVCDGNHNGRQHAGKAANPSRLCSHNNDGKRAVTMVQQLPDYLGELPAGQLKIAP